MQLSELKNNLLTSTLSEAKLVQKIHTLSQNFTQSRERISDYLTDPALISAYTYFYLPTNMAKMPVILDKLGKRIEDFNDYEIIDYGCGPGTYLMALLANGIKAKRLVGVETAELMRKQAQKLFQTFHPEENIELLSAYKEQENSIDQKKLLIFSHSANEMSEIEVKEIIKKINPKEVLFIEPGTKSFFTKMKSLRTHLIENTFHALYPCPSNHPCPMSDQDWCHQILKVSLDDDVKRLCQLVKRDRLYQPVSLFYFAQSSDRGDQGLKRVVQVFEETKFSLEFNLCESSATTNQLTHLQLMKKNLDKRDIKDLRQVYAGDQLGYTIDKKLPNGVVRGALGAIKK
ncbi:MAG: hypothetical protein CME62_10175 [Halobacteriovoraceae bacterium]|nr:hypothetical protein [Halobacteriovoraceae bacterium]|tara:strand:- start:20098 stop:21132 length:1035 start_codon:yes stop_codon:yes gene_type:complete